MRRYVATILGEEGPQASWPEGFLARLSEWGIALDPLGNDRWMISTFQGSAYGAAALFGLEAGRARYQSAAWASLRSACPFLEDLSTLGFLEWEEWDAVPEAREEWLTALVKEGKGLIARPGSGRYRSAVVELRRSASGLRSKYGFEDGDIFLTRDGGRRGYRAALCRQIEQMLAAHGLYTQVGGPEVSCHNLFRSYGGFYRDADRAAPIEDEAKISRRLSAIPLELWGYDFTIGDDPMFEDS
jgi:hypothetical protein